MNSDHRRLIAFLRGLRWRRNAVESSACFLVAATTFACMAMVLVVAESVLYLGSAWRSGLGAALLTAFVLLFVMLLHRRLRGRLSLWATALYAERRLPALEQRLISSFELSSERGRNYSPDLLSATSAEAAAVIAGAGSWCVVDSSSQRSALRLALPVAAGLTAIGWFFHDTLGSALERCLNPGTTYSRPIRTQIALTPGNVKIIEGDDLRVDIFLTGHVPRTATVEYRESAAGTVRADERLVTSSAGSLSYKLQNVTSAFEYRASAGDGVSPWYRVDVIKPPTVQHLRLRYAYPDYTSLPPRIDTDSGNISGLPGTEVHVEIIATKPLSAAAVALGDSQYIAAVVEDDRASLSMLLARQPSSHPATLSNGRYHINLRDLSGVANRQPIEYTIQVVDDELPWVELMRPGGDSDLPERHTLALGFDAGDDFGLSAADLVFQIAEQPLERVALAIPDDSDRRSLSLNHSWDLSSRNLLPEDHIRYHVEVFDNDTVSGPKMTASRELVLRVPSLYELFDEISSTQEESIDALEALAEEETRAQQVVEKLRRELAKEPKLDWHKEQELGEALVHQAKRTAAVEELAHEISAAAQKLEEHGLASEGVLDKLEKIRELMEEVTAPQLREALEELHDGMDSLEPIDLTDAMHEFAENREIFHQRLDRTIELLRRVHAEQRLEAAVRQARDLHSRQKQIDDQLRRAPQEAAKMAEQMRGERRDIERLSSELENLSEDLRGMSPSASDVLAAEVARMKAGRLSGRMKKMQEHLTDARTAEAERLGRSLEQDLGSLAAGLESAHAKFVAEQKRELRADMRGLVTSLLQLSFSQEDLGRRTRESPSGALTASHADKQFALAQGTATAIKEVGAISQKTMTMDLGLPATLGSALTTMEKAARHLGQNQSRSATQLQIDAMGYLNEAVLLLQESAQNLGRADMPSGFAESMDKMLGLSEQQAALNRATQETLAMGREPGQRGRSAADMRGQMRRLMEEQRRIYESLARLERKVRGNRGARKRVEALRESMERLLADMQHQRPPEQISQSQEHILQRMLEASRSMYSRGFKKDRQSKAAEDVTYRGPGSLPTDLWQVRDLLREAMKQALKGDYSPAHLTLIRRYYELMYGDTLVGTINSGDLP